ncbi:unnamed protein product [Musa acuminata subsp. burmannicoides]
MHAVISAETKVRKDGAKCNANLMRVLPVPEQKTWTTLFPSNQAECCKSHHLPPCNHFISHRRGRGKWNLTGSKITNLHPYAEQPI